MTDSILNTIKKKIGISEDDTCFDEDVLTEINTAGSFLSQLGVTSFDNFTVCDSSNTWDECISDRAKLADIKTYIYLYAKLNFDPPANAFLVQLLKDQLKECEWRINVAVDP